MKYAATLSTPEIITLEQLYQNGRSHRLRQRAHIILMSNNQLPLDTISMVASLDRDTISSVINNWELIGLIGLYDLPRSGRPAIFSEEDEKKIILKIEDEPRNLKKATSEINKETGRNASTKTVRRILKKHKKGWKRMKKTLAGKPDEERLEKAEAEIKELKKRKH